MECPRCQSPCKRNGVRNGKQRWKCLSCRYEFRGNVATPAHIGNFEGSFTTNFDEDFELRKQALRERLEDEDENFDNYTEKYSQRILKRKTVPPITNAGNVLIIGDTHEPYTHPDYFDFIRYQQDKWKCNSIVHIGDVVDNNSINYHEKDPDGNAPAKEFELTYKALRKWVRAFPKMKICNGNHDLLPVRQAQTAGLPRLLLRTNNEIWDLPNGWEWELYHELDWVIYQHGTGKSGKYMHINWAADNLQSTVTGHGHSSAGVGFHTARHIKMFGLGVGCGIDLKSFAFRYGENFARRPILGCGVVLENGTLPVFIPMEL